MRNVWTIARKELRSYFDHPTAYILLVVFLGINFFFYFRSVFLMGEASLRPMFDLLPWIFLFFIPAATMGALAEEKRQGTLELVLSHPLREHEFLLGKYLGNLLFIAIALAATLAAPLMLLFAGTPDFGVVVAQYVGALLLAGAMAAIGLFASAFTRNQITAFITGTFTVFALMLVGVEVVQISLPGWLADTLAQLGILSHFQNVTRGVLDLRDIVYFISVAGAFLALAYWLLLRERLNRSAPLYRNLQVGTAAILGIALLANLFGGYIPGRLDLTAENLYTLSDGTKQILRDVDDVVTVTLFVSDELPTQVEMMERDVRDLLRDFRRYGEGNVQVIIRHPEQSDEARQEAQRLGVQPVQFNVVRAEELQVKQGWLGLVVSYADDSEAIPFVGEVQNLEYQLASNVWKLTREELPKVAFVTGHGERSPSDYSSLRTELEQAYEVTTLELSAARDTTANDPIPDLDALIIAGPRQAIGPRARDELRRYLARDGRVLYLGEGVDVNLQFLFASAAPDSAVNVLEPFGVRVNGDLAFDLRSNEAIQVPGQFVSYVVAYPFWVRALPVSEHPIARDINSVFLPWPSSLDTVSAPGRSFMPLLGTTRYGGTQRDPFQIRPDQDLDFDRDQLETRLLAVAVEGAVNTEAPVEAGAAGSNGPASASGTAVGRAVVVGDADFLTDRFARGSPENVIFALNAIDWLTQSGELSTIRAKTATPRPLVFDSELEKQVIKYLNLVGVPLAFVIFGAFRLASRRRLTRRAYGS